MVDIVIQLLPHILAALIYGALGFHFWNTRWRESEGQCVACPMQTWERLAIAAALVTHAAGLYDALFADIGMRFSFSFALSLMMWLAVLIYWLESFMARMEGMQPMVLPLTAICTILPVIFPNVHLVAHANATGFKLHFLAAMLAYSLLTLESLLFKMLLVGFMLLTLTVGSGVFFSEEIFGKALTIDHKTLFAFASWGIFATLLIGRHAWGWRGKRALRWTLAGFALLILAYVGSRFVAEVILGRV